MQRARGTLAVAVKLRDGTTVLDRFRQEGCLKARLPRPENDAWTSLVTLNSSGGIVQGDCLNTVLTAGPGTALTVASQAAERYYRSEPGTHPAEIRTAINVASGAALEWLPQETILFEGCAVDRRLDIHLARDGWFLGVETLVFGRAAMGETLASIRLRDRVRVHRASRLIWQDAIHLDGAGQSRLDRPAVAAGGRAIATLVYAAPDAAEAVEPLRGLMTRFEAGVSAFEDLLIMRIVAPDGTCARAAIVAALPILRAGRPLPRVWSC